MVFSAVDFINVSYFLQSMRSTLLEERRIREAYALLSPTAQAVYMRLPDSDRTAEIAWSLVKAEGRMVEPQPGDTSFLSRDYQWHDYEAGKKYVPPCSSPQYEASIATLVERCRV